MFCYFIDFQKAYDMTDRLSLWYKLIQSGIDGKMLTAIRFIYTEVKLCVKHMNSIFRLKPGIATRGNNSINTVLSLS